MAVGGGLSIERALCCACVALGRAPGARHPRRWGGVAGVVQDNTGTM